LLLGVELFGFGAGTASATLLSDPPIQRLVNYAFQLKFQHHFLDILLTSSLINLVK
jgi:hypothetical protein